MKAGELREKIDELVALMNNYSAIFNEREAALKLIAYYERLITIHQRLLVKALEEK